MVPQARLYAPAMGFVGTGLLGECRFGCRACFFADISPMSGSSTSLTRVSHARYKHSACTGPYLKGRYAHCIIEGDSSWRGDSSRRSASGG